MKSKSKRTNQQPTGKRVEKRPPAWMYKIPAGVREFLGFAPLIAIAYVLSSYFNEWFPDIFRGASGNGRIFNYKPEGDYRLEPILDPVTGKLTAYRQILLKKPETDTGDAKDGGAS
jgi:hypothetical protein